MIVMTDGMDGWRCSCSDMPMPFPAPASPAHTAEIAAIPGADETLLREVLEDAFATDTETEDQLCALVTSLFAHTETQRAEIKALRDALDSINRALSTPPPMTREAQEGFSYHSAEEAYRVELCRLIIEIRDTARAALKGATK